MNKKELLAFLLIAAVFTLVEAKGLFVISPGDEDVYFYMAKSVSEGQVPYRDFFYAHPPLHLLALALVIRIFGASFVTLKSATLLALLTASFFLFKSSLEWMKAKFENKNSLLVSSIAIVLFLFSFEVMFKATFSLGIEMSVMLVMISFYLIITNKFFLGGLFGGLAGLTRIYAIVPIFAIFAFILVKKIHQGKIKDFLHAASGFFITFVLVILILIMLFGSRFTDSVFKYHLLKIKLPNQRLHVYKNILQENWVIIAAFLSSIFMRNKKKFQLLYFVAFSYMLFFVSLNVPAEFYFIMVFPFMAIIGAYSIVSMISKINAKFVKYTIFAIISAIFLWNTAADIMFLEKFAFMKFQPLSEMINDLSLSGSNGPIFGDDGTVSMLAFLTGRKIALNFIDSNEMRFTSGLSNFYVFKDQLDSVNLSFIIFRKGWGISQIRQFRDYAERRCVPEKEYTDLVEGKFLLYKC